MCPRERVCVRNGGIEGEREEGGRERERGWREGPVKSLVVTTAVERIWHI